MPASRFDQPALDRPGDDQAAGPATPGRDAEAMVLFPGGTWRLCRIRAWQRDPSGEWRVLLRWGVSGDLYEEWYVHNPERVRSAGSPRALRRRGQVRFANEGVNQQAGQCVLSLRIVTFYPLDLRPAAALPESKCRWSELQSECGV